MNDSWRALSDNPDRLVYTFSTPLPHITSGSQP
jgi:hypothetical protein